MGKGRNLFKWIGLLVIVILIPVAFLLFNRPHPQPQVPKEPQPAKPAQIDQEELDRIRSLGYTAFAPEKDDKGSGVILRKPESYPGYNFFTNTGLCSVVLVDEAGAVKNYWQVSDCFRLGNAEFLDSGDLLVVGTQRGPRNDPEDLSALRFLAKLSWNGDLIWKRSIPAHHDVEVTPSGHLLTITADLRSIPEIHPRIPVRDGRLTLLSSDGVVQDQCSLYDLFRAAPELVSIQAVKPKKGKEIDLFHANSIESMRPTQRTNSDPIYSLSNILFCTRHQDTIGIVDWKTRKLIWAWGQGEVSGPHDATMLADGHILLFDNGLSRGWSRVIELDPLTKQILWQYKAPKPEDFFSVTRGSNQRLPNGNTLISQSDIGRAFEVNPNGSMVWEFRNPFQNRKGRRAAIVRMVRIERDKIDHIVRLRGEGRHQAPFTPTDRD